MDFLAAGGSDDPLETLKKAGVDMGRPDALKAAFRRINGWLDEMERLAARGKRKEAGHGKI
jgi:oligoendopeptidase F